MSGRYLYIYVATAALMAAACPTILGQGTQEQPEQPAPELEPPPSLTQPPATPPMLPDGQPQAGGAESRPVPQSRRRPQQRRQTPLSQYSPYAAAGGYSHHGVSPWEAIVNYFNPNLDLGRWWEQRRAAWLDNAAYNPYFWYAFWLTMIVMISWIAIYSIQTDRVRETWELAAEVSDALRYAEYCKRNAERAIARHNKHVELCNRVVEFKRSGMVTPETAHVENFRAELEKATADKTALQLDNQRLQEEINRKSAEMQSLTQRVTAAEERFAQAPQSANAELVARINRLEAENRRLSGRRPSNGSAPEQNTSAEA
jgi:hypothetical protein